jgi:hypothetical protein
MEALTQPVVGIDVSKIKNPRRKRTGYLIDLRTFSLIIRCKRRGIQPSEIKARRPFDNQLARSKDRQIGRGKNREILFAKQSEIVEPKASRE